MQSLAIGDLHCRRDRVDRPRHLALQLDQPIADKHCNQRFVLYNKYSASSIHLLC